MATTGQKILTAQKRLVIEAVKEMPGLFTAQDICERMVEKQLRASRATIYRMLTELSEEGVVREVWLPNNRRMCVRSDEPVICIVECVDCGKLEVSDAKNAWMEIGLLETGDVQTTIHRRVKCPRRDSPGAGPACKPAPPVKNQTYRRAIEEASKPGGVN